MEELNYIHNDNKTAMAVISVTSKVTYSLNNLGFNDFEVAKKE